MATETYSNNVGILGCIDLVFGVHIVVHIMAHLYRLDVLHIPQVIRNFDNARELTEINLKKGNYFYKMYADGIVSLDLDFKRQFGNRLLVF